MSPLPIPRPDVGPAAARLSLWYVQPGERVYEGDRVAEIALPGATVDVPAPATGVLRERLALPNDAVGPGQVIGTIDPDPEG